MINVRPLFQILFLAWIASAAPSCAVGSANVSNGTYTSPLGNFSLPVPQFAYGVRINEVNDALGGYVSFQGEIRGFDAISYLLVPTNDAETFEDATFRDRAYSSYLHNILVAGMFTPVSEKTRVIHEEFLGQNVRRELFAVVDIPEGSHRLDVISGKRFDAKRALLIFYATGCVYALHIDIQPGFEKTGEYILNVEQLRLARQNLRSFKERIEFR